MAGSPVIRVALAGCGRLGSDVFLPLLTSMPGVSLEAVADPEPDSLSRVQAHGSRIRVERDWRALADSDGLDAVVVCLPSAMHAEAATAYLRNGLAVYIEKPMATTLDAAAAILEASRRGPTAMVGFNYRANPLYEEQRARVREQRTPIRAVRTVFTTPRTYHSGWRTSPATGGGVLFDLASHHFDLVRYLTGCDVAEVSATTDGSRNGGERVAVSARLESGVPATFIFATGTVDQDSVEVLGDGWSVSVDRYRSLEPLVRGAAVPGRGESALRAVVSMRRLPHVLRKLREPWHEPSFRIALERFIDAVRAKRAASPAPLDGFHSLAAVLAAHESIATGRAVPVRQPAASAVAGHSGQAQSVPPAAAADREIRPDIEPVLSAILLVPAKVETLSQTLRALHAQDIRSQMELVFVSPAEQLDLPQSVSEFWGCQHVRIPRLDSTSVARAEGIRHARAPIVVLTEDHSFATPGWAAALVRAHEQDWAGVGPAMLNANPATAISWSNLAIEYGPWLHPAPPGAASHIAGHNAAYKRSVLLEYGDRLGEIMEAESVLHWDLRQRGYRVAVAPDARIRHMNFSRLFPAIVVKFNLGRTFADSRSRHWSLARRAVYTVGSLLLPFIRTVRGLGDLRRAGAPQPAWRLACALFALLTSSALGEMVGYSIGAGGSMQCLTRHEFDRKIYLTPRDQALMYPS